MSTCHELNIYIQNIFRINVNNVLLFIKYFLLWIKYIDYYITWLLEIYWLNSKDNFFKYLKLNVNVLLFMKYMYFELNIWLLWNILVIILWSLIDQTDLSDDCFHRNGSFPGMMLIITVMWMSRELCLEISHIIVVVYLEKGSKSSVVFLFSCREQWECERGPVKGLFYWW